LAGYSGAGDREGGAAQPGKGGARDDDAYLADWRKAAPVAVSDDLQGEAEAMARQLEEEYDGARLKALIANGGREG
jgi:hypothetical protein